MSDDLFSTTRSDKLTPDPMVIADTPLTARCPNCGRVSEGVAIVDYWLDQPDWDFYGEEGDRAIICKGATFIHFRAGRCHRLAWSKQLVI